MSFDEAVLTQGNDKEKTFIDKVLAKDDTNKLSALVSKKDLSREELLQALYYIAATESKLVNYSDWDRYVMLKYFIWVQEFIKISELMYDFEDRIKEKAKKGEIVLTDRARRIFDNNTLLMQHNAKFLIMLYLNIARTSLSLGAAGMREVLTNKFEIVYPQESSGSINQNEGRLGFGGGKK